MAEDLMDKVFSFFAGEDISDEKQNMLKQIAKELSHCKYSKFFRIRTDEADPSFLSFLFSIYRMIYPIKKFFQDGKKVAMLKQYIIESCLDSKIKETISRLDPSALESKSKTMSGEQLIAEIQADINALVTQFDQNKVYTANRRYEMAASLAQFSTYNFFGFFKKFDPHFADGSFIVEPRFSAVKLILIINEMEAFLTVTQPLKPEDDWAGLFSIMKMCEGQDMINTEQFTNMITTVREIHSTKIIELMVQYTLRNPVWQWKQVTFRETIGEEWLEEKQAEANGYIQKINTAKKNGQISALTKQIFEATDLVRLENYTLQLSEQYRRRKLEYFVYAEGLNYLKAFLDDYVVKEINELSDILIIRGQWTNGAMSREMSESLHRLLEASEPIARMDAELSEDGPDGSRLRTAMLRIDRDQTQGRYVNSIIAKNNEIALDIINHAAQDLIVIGKHLKNLIEDVQKKHPELLINWRELTLASKDPLPQRMITDFKRINYFVQLMHLCTTQ
ncbi:MAG: DUF5312 family protein [Treponema sp.]|jgi:hypothetical protein|nr:DUF5312 family protein [Treponema sp.]